MNDDWCNVSLRGTQHSSRQSAILHKIFPLAALHACLLRLPGWLACTSHVFGILTWNKEINSALTSRPKRSRFCHIFLVQSLVWKYCLKLEGCLHNFFLIGPYSAAAEPNSAPKIVTQFLEPSLVLLRRFCLNVRTLRMPLNPRNHRCRYTLHSWSLV